MQLKGPIADCEKRNLLRNSTSLLTPVAQLHRQQQLNQPLFATASMSVPHAAFFLNPPRQAAESMKKRCHSGRPAKIAPLKPPKEIHNNTTPRCAMEATLSDHQMPELGESQEGKYEEAGGGTETARIKRTLPGASD